MEASRDSTDQPMLYTQPKSDAEPIKEKEQESSEEDNYEPDPSEVEDEQDKGKDEMQKEA